MDFDVAEAYRRMLFIRMVEEEIANRYKEGKMRCPVHLSIGQEAVAVGVCMALEPGDHVWSTHRCHAHYLAMGGDLDAMIAELYGKATGCTRGWGGSMHLADESVGFMGTSPIVGSSLALALGSAMYFKMSGSPNVAVAFVGDSGPETGTFWETLNFASLHKLPLVIVEEDNGLSTQTPLSQRQNYHRDGGFKGLAYRVQEFVPAMVANDRWERVFHSSEGVMIAIEDIWHKALYARSNVPSFLKVNTYRYHTHVGPEYDWELGLTHRTREEVEKMMAQDPLKDAVIDSGYKILVETKIKEAFKKAEEASWPQNGSQR